MQHIIDTNIEVNNITGTTVSDVMDISNASSIAIQCVIDVNTPAAKTFNSERVEVQTLTFPTFAATTDRDYIVVEDTAAVKYAVYADKTGTSIAPTGPIYLAATHKVKANISGATTAAQVAAIFETAFNTLTGFTAAITTDDTANDGTMTLTQVIVGPVTNPVPKSLADAGAGSLAGVQTTAGLVSNLDLTDDTITIAAHGLPSGLLGRLTTTGTLPAGVTTGTDYFVIVVDASTIKLAESLADALAGTDIDLTDEGTGVHTFTATALAGASVTFQKSNDNSNWTNTASATSITADATVWFEDDAPGFKYARLSYTLTAGSMSTDNFVLVKGLTN